ADDHLDGLAEAGLAEARRVDRKGTHAGGVLQHRKDLLGHVLLAYVPLIPGLQAKDREGPVADATEADDGEDAIGDALLAELLQLLLDHLDAAIGLRRRGAFRRRA